MGYGALTPMDVRLLESALEACLLRFPDEPINVLEVGVASGQTSRGMKEFVESRERSFVFEGVDNNRIGHIAIPFEGATMVYETSELAYDKVGSCHLALIDGCHCLNHVILDIVHFGDKVVPGGYMYLHDTGRPNQGMAQDNPCHLSVLPIDQKCVVEVRKAVELLGLLNNHPRWEFVREEDPESPTGGSMLFKRR